MDALNQLLSPVGVEDFGRDHHDRSVLHIPADDAGSKREVLPWSQFNALLSQAALWTPGNLRMMSDNAPVPLERYCSNVQTQAGETLRPDPRKLEVMMSSGASLIVNDVHTLTPDLARVAAMLSREYAASVAANVYCSFQGVQAFGTHFDLHDVFVVQTEGTKLWRFYEARAESPVDFPMSPEDTRMWFLQTRGQVTHEVKMRAGDVLYVPRGQYHDALAQDGASLHVTFSVTPLYGRIMFRLLEQAALQNPAFRLSFPPAWQDGGRALQARLTELGQHLARLAAHPAFRDEVAMAQERLVQHPPAFSLPDRKPLTAYRPTSMSPPAFEGPVAHAMAWAFSQRRFLLEDLIAQFDFVDPANIRQAVEAAVEGGALEKAA